MTRRPHLSTSPLRSRIRAAIGILLTVGGAALGSEGTDSREYQIKAAFLYNFTRFVEWPASSFADADSPIVIGAYCADPFTQVLREIVSGRTVNGRSIVVQHLQAPAAAQATHVTFICADSDALSAYVEAAVRIYPVLTVGETAAAAEQGVIIKFGLEADRVRFEINAAAAERAGLKVSAQLQKLATAVRRSP